MVPVEKYTGVIHMIKNEIFKVKGRILSNGDIDQIVEMVKLYPRLSRKELIKTICVNLRWSAIAEGVSSKPVEDLLLEMESKEMIKLPPKKEGNWSKQVNKKKPSRRKYTIPITEKTNPRDDVIGTINDFMPVELRLIKDVEEEFLWDEYVERYHVLKYGSPFGDRLKYFICIGKEQQYAGCMMFSASSWALQERDKWIGWTKEDRVSKLYLLINNTRFLIFPWIKIRNLASWSLAQASRRIQKDWWRNHRYTPVLLETFVDAEKYTGTCYKAANWIYLGNTKGRGRQDRNMQYLSSPKKIYVYPLVKDFKDYLTGKKEQVVTVND